jgi:serine/threonine protein kinase
VNFLHSGEATSATYFQLSVQYLNSHMRRSLPFIACQPRPTLLRIPSMKFSARARPTYTAPLDWQTRLGIALDCARVLEFVHVHSSPAVIHCNFKSSNILQDHNFHARVSDFGMAKVGSNKADGQVVTRVLGTTGYVAPEYAHAVQSISVWDWLLSAPAL